MRILAIDPGRRSGWALYEGRDLVASGATRRTKDDRDLWEYAQACLADTHPDLLVIEGQFVSKFLRSALSVAKSAQVWACTAYQAGIPVTEVQAAEWQAAFISLPQGAKRNREMLAAATKTLAERIKGKPCKTPDEASAICIGAWAVQQEVGK